MGRARPRRASSCSSPRSPSGSTASRSTRASSRTRRARSSTTTRSEARSRTAPWTSSSRTSTSRPRSRSSCRRTTRASPGAATAGLRQASYQIVDRALEQPVFQDLFRVALEESHTTLVQVLEGGGDRVSTDEGEVIARPASDHHRGRGPDRDRRPGRRPDPRRRRPDRRPALRRARHGAERVPAPEDARLGTPPPHARRIRPRRLARPRSPTRRPRDRRRARSSSGSSALAAARLTRNYVVDSLVARRDDREAAGDAWDILTDLMRGSFRLMIVVGLLFLLAAWLAGPGRRALDRPRLARTGACRTACGPTSRSRSSGFAMLLTATVARLHAPARRRGHRRARRDLDRAVAPPDAARVSRTRREPRSSRTPGTACRAGGTSSARPATQAAAPPPVAAPPATDVATRLAVARRPAREGRADRRGVRVGQGSRARRATRGRLPAVARRTRRRGLGRRARTRHRRGLARRRGRAPHVPHCGVRPLRAAARRDAIRPSQHAAGRRSASSSA